jgi:phosphoserine phosphatase RsbU/P
MAQTLLFKKIPLLSDLPRPEIDYLGATLKVVNLNPGEILFRENEPGECLYIILEGRVEVLLALGTSDERVLGSFGPGEFIGEMSLLIPGRARTASVRAAELSRLWTMTRNDFDDLLIRQPKLSYTIVQTLTKRLDATTMLSFRDLQEKNRQLQQAYDELKAAQVQIIEKERLEREIQVAAEIQVSILPQELPQISGYDFGSVMQPARMVGGDFYDVFPLEGIGMGIVIGDVADKGIPSAIFMARAHALIMAEANHGGTPGEILRRANHHLIQLAQSDLFVTVLFGILDDSTNTFDFARAGHELPLLLSPDGQVESPQRGSGQPIGMIDSPLMDEKRLTIHPGSTLLLFTDGVTDCSDPQDEQFGHDHLSRSLAGLVGAGAQETCDRLLQTLKQFQSTASQADDITLVALHRS